MVIFLMVLFALPAKAEIVVLDGKNKELFIDESGFYRYVKAEDIFAKNCRDSSTEAIKKRCLKAEKNAWERGKSPDEIRRQGTLFSGKIVERLGNKNNYFYVKDGKKGEQINLVLNKYYFENGLLHDIKTEEPFSGEIVIGGVEGLSADGKSPRFIAQQRYENGLPVGEPELVSVE